MTLQSWHICNWGVSPILLCRTSSAVRLDGEHCCTAIFRSLQRCSIGCKSGCWLGHSRTFRDLSRSRPCFVLSVCLGLLSSLTVNRCPQSEVPERSGAGFHQGSLCTLLRSSFSRSWLVSTLWSAAEMIVLQKVLPSPQRNSVNDHRVLGHLPDQGPSPPICSVWPGSQL